MNASANDLRRFSTVVLAASLCMTLRATAGPGDFVAPTPPEGSVRVFGVADTSFAPFLDGSKENVAWINGHYGRMLVFAPAFDPHTAWYGKGWDYKDLYAIYNCEEFGEGGVFASSPECIGEPLETWQLVADHPEWILRDDEGNPLYIPFACQGGVCPQFAADIGNPDFQEHWIEQAAAALAGAEDFGGAYRGVFIDDVNLDFDRSVSDGDACTRANPACDWDSTITRAEWAEAVAELTERIRSDLQTLFPHLEIVHNNVWFHVAPGDPELGDLLERTVEAADVVNLERGINDANFTPAILLDFLAFNDYVHGRGRRVAHYVGVNRQPAKGGGGLGSVLVSPLAPPLVQLEYGLAGWLLVSEGRDWFGSRERARPDDWWSGLEVDLGHALGDRLLDPWSGLLCRDFEYGMVLLNGPGSWPVTVTLPAVHTTLAGVNVGQVQLGSRIGRILLRTSGRGGGCEGVQPRTR